MTIEKIGNATLYLGDCKEILPSLPNFDLILTDPPYGIGVAKKGKVGGGTKKAPSTDFGEVTWDNAPPPQWLFGLMQEKSNHQIIFGGNYFDLPPTSCMLVWDKDNGKTDFADCELAWTNIKQAVRLFKWRWNGFLQQDMKNKEIREHPTQKPVPVMEWCIEQVKITPTTICDPFMGGGSTGVAAMKKGIEFVGIEREQKYFDVACRRIEQAQKSLAA